MLKPLHDPKDGILRVAGFMSGSGTNLRKIIDHGKKIEQERGKAPYEIAAIFTDNSDSNAPKIQKDYDIPLIVRDLKGFCSARGRARKDLQARAEFDMETVRALSPYEAKAAVYCGYMSIATDPLINAFLGVNVHPGDLSVMNGNKRKYTGSKAVKEAILAGERYIRSTTHVMERAVDYGRILMISPPSEVMLGDDLDPNNEELVNKVAAENQSRLKEVGDWVVFPKTLEYIADGRYQQDGRSNLYFDGKAIPKGLKYNGDSNNV